MARRGSRLALVVWLVGCTPPAPPAGGQVEHAFRLPTAAADAPTLPGPAPRMRSFDAAAVNAECAGCHVDVAAEWGASLHRQSHTDADYRSQFAKEPFAFCTGCHAPEADPAGDVPAALSHLGVGCVTCHVIGDQILAGLDPRDEDGTHHALRRSAAFASADACAACHEFAFPPVMGGPQGLLMQSTISEHAGSEHAAEPCASCHMPVVEGQAEGPHKSHAFVASRDEATIRSAVVVEVGFEGDTFTLAMSPGKVGHAFPTGDMLRRIALVIDVRDEHGAVVAHHERYFMRHFGFRRARHKPLRRVLLGDDRVGVDGVTHSYRITATRGRLAYALRYERVLDPHGDEGRGTVAGSIMLAEGVLPFSR